MGKKKIKKQLEKVLEGEEAIVVATDHVHMVKGEVPKVMFIIQRTLQEIIDDGVDKKYVEECISLAWKEPEELTKIFKEKLEELEKTINEVEDKIDGDSK